MKNKKKEKTWSVPVTRTVTGVAVGVPGKTIEEAKKNVHLFYDVQEYEGSDWEYDGGTVEEEPEGQ